MIDREAWQGTSTELLNELTLRDRAEQRPSSWKGFPRDPADLGKRLRKASAVLRKADNIEVAFVRMRDRQRTKLIDLRRAEHRGEQAADQPAASDNASAPGKVITLRDRS